MRVSLCPIRGCGKPLDDRVFCEHHWTLVPRELRDPLVNETARSRGASRVLLRAIALIQATEDGVSEDCARPGCDLPRRTEKFEPRVCLVCYHEINVALRGTLKLLWNKGSPLPGYAEAVASAMDQFKGRL